MLKALLVIVRAVPAWLLELAGACLVVAGVHQGWGVPAALVVGGAALILKAFELDLRGDA